MIQTFFIVKHNHCMQVPFSMQSEDMFATTVHFALICCFILWPNQVASSCNFDVKMTQTLLNEGFHRNISYAVVFRSEDNQDQLYMDCIVGIDQTLPAGVYVNPDELGDLKRHNKITAIPKNRVNVELPTEQSSASNVFLIGSIRAGGAYLWLPVHARYHQARSGGGTARNEIGPPKLYLRCPDQRLQACNKEASPTLKFLCNGSSKEKCSWMVVPYTMMTAALLWDVPAGNTDHYNLVSTGTLAIIVIGSLYLLKAVHEYQIKGKKRQ